MQLYAPYIHFSYIFTQNEPIAYLTINNKTKIYIEIQQSSTIAIILT